MGEIVKNKVKKIIAGISLGAVLGTSGIFMSGCSMSEEQQNALNVITENTETLVESFDSYLDGQNNKMDKEKAFDMLKHARLKSQYILEESEVCSIGVRMSSEDKDVGSMDAIYDFSGSVKKMLVEYVGEDEISLAKYDMNNLSSSYSATIGEQTILSLLDEGWYLTNINANIDALSQAGINVIDIDDITRVVAENDEYTFNIMQTDINYDGEKYMQVINFATIVVKDYLFKSVNVQCVRKEGRELSFRLDEEDNRIPDGYGSYLFSGSVVGVIELNAEYKYGNDVDLSELNSKISDIDAKIASGDLVIQDE